jgi:hypothetical protein
VFVALTTSLQGRNLFNFFDDDRGGHLTCHEIIEEVCRENIREVTSSHGSVSTGSRISITASTNLSFLSETSTATNLAGHTYS